MSEPHIIVEREYEWDDFYPLLLDSQRIVKIRDRLYQPSRFQHISKNGKERIIFFNGSHVDYRFMREFNEKVKYGLSIFYPVIQIFDTEETDEMEEVWLMDGMVEDRPIMKQLETYKLFRVEVVLYQPQEF